MLFHYIISYIILISGYNQEEKCRTMIITADGKRRTEIQEDLLPTRVIESHEVEYAEGLMIFHAASVSFQKEGWTRFHGSGSYVVLDFGKELCGGIRMITRDCKGCSRWRVTFGESLTESYAFVGYKNATNDHSPRDMEMLVSSMSDLQFGQTGFRFVRLELLTNEPAIIQSVFAVSHLPKFEKEATIVTSDSLLNEIINTATYTLKLNFQNGYIWDGIKRDRLVWCGDLHPEILASMYLFGDNDNIQNSLLFLRDSTPTDKWMNTVPSYSAWWVINLCDYCQMTGNRDFFLEHRDYAKEIISRYNRCIKEDGNIEFPDGGRKDYFLDWSTRGTDDAVVGVRALLCLMAEKYLAIEENEECHRIHEKLADCIEAETVLKPVRAFQVLAGRNKEDYQMLEEGGAQGFSTFMAYYILTAMANSGGTKMLQILKEYYGGMLSKGATSFWEDFDISWMENSCRIDELPKEGKTDIHGDYGRYCYKQFRHSLCHGWSSGVVAFVVEYILGIHIENGGEKVYLSPHLLGIQDVEAKIPLKTGWLKLEIHGDEVSIEAPEGTEIVS